MSSKAPAFIPSKWETVDPEQVEAQAVTTSKWESLDPPMPPKFYDQSSGEDDDDNSSSFDDIKRKKLREIELKAMQYQDELETGEQKLKPGWSIKEQVEYYRLKLLEKVETICLVI